MTHATALILLLHFGTYRAALSFI